MKQNGWIRFVSLIVMIGVALFLAIVSGPKPKQVSEVTTLAPFYQKDAFLVAVVRLGAELRREDIDLARKLVAAKYLPIDESARPVPFDAIIGMEKNGIVVAPGPFFCRDGRYAESDLPLFQAKDPADALRYIEAIAEAQRKICSPLSGSSKKYI